MAKDIPIGADTIAALQAAIAASGLSLRHWAERHGVSCALVSDVLRGHDRDVSVRSENRLRAVLGLSPRPPRVPATACPDCLARGVEVVHGDGLRCHGREGVVAFLGPDEQVIRRRANGNGGRRYWCPALDGDSLPEEIRAWWRNLSPRARAEAIARAAEDHWEDRE